MPMSPDLFLCLTGPLAPVALHADGPTHVRPPPPDSDSDSDSERLVRDPLRIGENLYTSEHFAVHWGTERGPELAHVEVLLDHLERAWTEGIERFGHAPHETSATTFLNVYIGNTGSRTPELDFPGAYVTQDADGVPYIVVNTEILPYADAYPEYLEGVAVHEMYHVFQFITGTFPYSRRANNSWYWEGTANWFSEQVLPDNSWTHANGALYPLAPHVSLTHASLAPSDPYAGRQYATTAFARFLTEQTGDDQLIARSWQRAGDEPSPLVVLDGLLAESGTGIDELFSWFGAYTVTFDYDHGHHYADWLDVYLDTTPDERWVAVLTGEGSAEPLAPPSGLLPRPHGYNVVRLDAPVDDTLVIDFVPEETGSEGSPARFYLRAVSLREGAPTYAEVTDGPAEAGQYRVTGVAGADEVHLIVSAQPPAWESNEETFGYTVAVGPPPEDESVDEPVESTDSGAPPAQDTTTDAPTRGDKSTGCTTGPSPRRRPLYVGFLFPLLVWGRSRRGARPARREERGQ